MRILCGRTPHHFAGGGPVFLLVIETPATVIAVTAIAISPTCADSRKTVAYPLDTERLFGFNEAADIGREGEKEFATDSTLRDGRGTGSFANTASALTFQKFRISAAGALAYYEITLVSGIEAPHRAAVQSLFSSLRGLVDRDPNPLGLTVRAAPHWDFVDETSGLRAGRSPAKSSCTHDSAFGRWAALAEQITAGVWLVVKTRYLSDYTQAAVNAFSGRAAYVGPTLYARIARTLASRTARDYRIPREATVPPGTLDLTNFQRHQAKLLLSVNLGARL
jgi:hypothetical protein